MKFTIGDIITVTPYRQTDYGPYRAKITGFDLGHTKYRVVKERSPGVFAEEDRFGYWAFEGEASEIHFPMPNDKVRLHLLGDYERTVIASVHFREDDFLATVVLLNPTPPFYTVATVRYGAGDLEVIEVYYHRNIVPAINGDFAMADSDGNQHGDVPGYTDMGGDY